MKKIKKTPPAFADSFLEWYCNPDLLEDLQGDLYERYANRSAKYGTFRARLMYFWDVFSFMKPYTFKKDNQIPSLSPFFMFSNYFKTSYRNLIRQKINTVVNIFGLSLGLAAFILIFLFVNDELKYDRYLTNADRIYRVTMSFTSETSNEHTAWSKPSVGPELKARYPEVEAYASLVNEKVTARYNNDYFREEKFYYTTKGFFEVFPYEFLKGNAKSSFNQGEAVITACTANKYFGETDPINQSIEIDHKNYKVVGVLKDLPPQTDLKFDALMVVEDLDNYGWSFNFILFRHKNDAEFFQPKLDQTFAETVQMEFDEYNTTGQYHMEALPDVHFGSAKLFDTSKSSRSNLYLFSTIALLTLIIATINYVNISLAGVSKRQAEVGIRKSIGAQQGQLKMQFLLESFIVCMLSLIVAACMTIFYLPQMNFITDKQIPWQELSSPGILLFITCITVVLSLIAGSYPAIYLASVKPVDILKGKTLLKGQAFLRKGLVVIQFVISIFLIVAALLISRQLNLIQNKSHGFDKDQVVVLDIPAEKTIRSSLGALQNNLKQYLFIKSTSLVGEKSWPTADRHIDVYEVFVNNEWQLKPFNNIQVDENYFDLLNLQLLKGRAFNANDMDGKFDVVMVNKAFVDNVGWTNPLEQTIVYENGHESRVVGVIEDFHFNSIRNKVEPMLIIPDNLSPQKLMVKATTNNWFEVLEALESTWEKNMPAQPFEFQFLNHYFQEQYISEKALKQVFTHFMIIAILIACLGLFSLIALNTNQKLKEVGVRKVFGANTSQLLVTLSKDYIVLVFISIALATPIAIIGMNQWLKGFVYKTAISPDIFLFAGGVTILLAIATMSFHVIKASHTNPCNILKNE